jgi:hypothetical protein
MALESARSDYKGTYPMKTHKEPVKDLHHCEDQFHVFFVKFPTAPRARNLVPTDQL